MNREFYNKLISGQSGGLSAISLRFCLRFAAACYSIAIRLRNFWYSKGWSKIHKVNVIVFSIGNITVGGTGKTPLVIWLCNLLRQKNVPCVVLTRGYKTQTQYRESNIEHRVSNIDEPAILAENCPQTQVIVNPNRVAGALEAVNKFGAKVLILDDGFQHRRLARDLDIVTIDATLPFGYGKLLPAGLLREPATSLKRANAVVITRCNQTAEAELVEIEKSLRQINRNMIIVRSIHAPACAKTVENKEISLDKLKNKKIFAFCGIGNPGAFFETIKGLESNLIGSKVYNDHHHYKESDIADIFNHANDLGVELILTTQKDWASAKHEVRNTKYEQFFAFLAIEIQFLSGEDKLKALIKSTLADKIPAK